MLVSTGELDPIYTMAYRAREVKGDPWVMRFLLYMLMFYEAKGAAAAADADDFWGYVRTNYATATRGRERRYFRGEAGIASYTSLEALGEPEIAFLAPVQARVLPEFRKALEARKIAGFGDYFMLKWADYLANVFLNGLSFEHLPFMLPSPPLKCLKQVFPDLYVKDALGEIASWISDMPDPFSGRKKCGYSEAETVACAIPTYLIKKRYYMGEDIDKYRSQLADRPDLLQLLPPAL
jgi:hypothetical protein